MLARQWAGGYQNAEIVLDRDLKVLPPHIPTWVLGWENTFAERFLQHFDNGRFKAAGDELTLAGRSYPKAEHSLVLADAEPGTGNISALIASDDPRALRGLARKLPHYGKYSYLLFSGERPDNQAKGQWSVTRSPLRIPLTDRQVEIQPLRPTPLWPANSNRSAENPGYMGH